MQDQQLGGQALGGGAHHLSPRLFGTRAMRGAPPFLAFDGNRTRDLQSIQLLR